MNTLDYIAIIIALMVVVLFIVLIIRGKRNFPNTTFGHILRGLIVVSLASAFMLTFYYEYQQNCDIKRLDRLQNQILYQKLDSLSFTNEEKNRLLDSLKRMERELDNILSRVEQQEKVIGKKAELVEKVRNIKKNADSRISQIEKYNESIDGRLYVGKHKGHTVSGETSLFTFQPPLATDGNYLDFIIKFHDESLIDKVAVIYVEVFRTKEDGKRHQIYRQYYKPQRGINAFRLKNYGEKGENIWAHFGFFWKSDFGKNEYPHYEKVTYYFNK